MYLNKNIKIQRYESFIKLTIEFYIKIFYLYILNELLRKY